MLQDSVMDIRAPVFKKGSVEIKDFMDDFPFPFYVILRDINSLPAILGDALRQWFELVTAGDQMEDGVTISGEAGTIAGVMAANLVHCGIARILENDNEWRSRLKTVLKTQDSVPNL